MKQNMMVLLFTMLIYALTSNQGVEAQEETPLFFRKDYTFIKEFNAFYKEHKIAQNWSEAVQSCSGEASQLFIPSTKEEAEAAFGIVKNKPDWVGWVGYHDIFSEGDFLTLDGESLDNVFINWGEGEPNNVNNDEDCVTMGKDLLSNDISCSYRRHFICKKSAVGLKQNPVCETYDTAYNYSLETDHCYKFHNIPMKWTNAFKTCRSEESQLAVINSEVEAKLFVAFFAKYPENSLKENFDKGVIHLGFNDLISPGLFLTVEGKHISEAGYEHWGSGQPDNRDGVEHCGSMFRDGSLNDVNCENRAMFICEKTLSSVDQRINVRTGDPQIKV